MVAQGVVMNNIVSFEVKPTGRRWVRLNLGSRRAYIRELVRRMALVHKSFL
jgi:hypothetical protein